MSVVGVILTGGLSRRFGSPKALAMYESHMFYEIVAQRLAPFVDKVIISTSKQLLPRWEKAKNLTNIKIVTDEDRFAGEGPLAGIYSAMVAEEADQYLVLPCDTPFIGVEILEQLICSNSSADVIAFQCQNRKHPLVGFYRRSNLEQIALFLESGNRRVMDYLTIVETSWIMAKPEYEGMFQNINQPQDLQVTNQ
ncbi:MAG TPA: molybdenum cofactor guanylyltransferase [Ureibacillus sp.]|nr:molybdenum cofactor guanylyltransferase [Ureibacillus sp.]